MAGWQLGLRDNAEDAMKLNPLFKAKVALAASRPGADTTFVALRFGVAVADVEAWIAQLEAWRLRLARRAGR
jgi:transposase-like protein